MTVLSKSTSLRGSLLVVVVRQWWHSKDFSWGFKNAVSFQRAYTIPITFCLPKTVNHQTAVRVPRGVICHWKDPRVLPPPTQLSRTARGARMWAQVKIRKLFGKDCLHQKKPGHDELRFPKLVLRLSNIYLLAFAFPKVPVCLRRIPFSPTRPKAVQSLEPSFRLPCLTHHTAWEIIISSFKYHIIIIIISSNIRKHTTDSPSPRILPLFLKMVWNKHKLIDIFQ